MIHGVKGQGKARCSSTSFKRCHYVKPFLCDLKYYADGSEECMVVANVTCMEVPTVTAVLCDTEGWGQAQKITRIPFATEVCHLTFATERHLTSLQLHQVLKKQR